jgi:hypothetical protein
VPLCGLRGGSPSRTDNGRMVYDAELAERVRGMLRGEVDVT